jgi:hypothetical protein
VSPLGLGVDTVNSLRISVVYNPFPNCSVFPYLTFEPEEPISKSDIFGVNVCNVVA